MLPILPLVALVAGAGLLLLGLNSTFQQTWLLAILAAAAALLALAVTAFFLPATATLSAWAPADLFRVSLALRIEPLDWLFGMAILVLTLATLLTSVTRPGGPRLMVRGAMLVLAAAGLAAVFADNLPTRIMAWAGLDFIYFLILAILARSEGMERQSVLNWAFNSTGTLLAVGAGVLISRTSPTLALRDAALSPQSTLLLTLAAVFRLGLFPLHLGLPAEANLRQGMGTLLRLVPAVVALELVGRLAAFGFAEAVRPWLTLFAVLAAVAGAGQLWTIADPRLGLTYIVVAQSGLALLAGLWGGAQAVPALTACGLALVLGGGLLYLSDGPAARRPSTYVAPLLGAAAVLGLPLTVGAAGTTGLLTGLLNGQQWFVLAGVLTAELLLAAGLWRAAFWQSEPDEVEPLASALHGAGLLLLISAIVLLGLFAGAVAVALGSAEPAQLLGSTLVATALTVVVTAAGFGLWRLERVVSSGAALAALPLTLLARLDWLYRLVWAGVALMGAAVRNVAEVLEGEGALLWALVAGLLVWLVVR